MSKDPTDLIEKPLHAVGLHGGSAVTVLIAVAALALAWTLWWRRQQTLR